MDIREFQSLMDRTYRDRDTKRGVPSTIAWLAEEVGELAKASRKGTFEEQVHEAGDVLAWLASLANQLGVDLDEAASRFADGCPRCTEIPCTC
jgi:NTP pyrophosphatase (non-canonical NTP hydrolase)